MASMILDVGNEQKAHDESDIARLYATNLALVICPKPH